MEMVPAERKKYVVSKNYHVNYSIARYDLCQIHTQSRLSSTINKECLKMGFDSTYTKVVIEK